MQSKTRRTLLLGLFAGALAVTMDAEAKGRSGRRSGGGRSKGAKGGYGSGGNGSGDDSNGCGTKGGPGGPRDKNGKCPGWKK